MVFSIDLDRGVQMSSHPSLGIDIYMYIDDPGIYYTAHGNPISSELARAAGFDVDAFEKKHKIKLALAKANQTVLDEFNENPGPKLVEERDGFKIMDIGMGRHNVVGPDGDVLHKTPITLEQANILLDNLAPKPEPKPVEDPKPRPSFKKADEATE
jgi:hypothetical protein